MMDKDNELSGVSPELIALVFSLFLKYLTHTIHALDYVENRDEITAENFLHHLERTIESEQDQIRSHGLNYEYVQKIVGSIRDILLEIGIHNLLNWDPKEGGPKEEDPMDEDRC